MRRHDLKRSTHLETYLRPWDLPQDSGRDPICSVKGGIVPTTRTPLAIGIIPSRRDGGYVAERVL